ncbi:right-handed parallel beta-helix repeat-containing protein [Pantoea cypripedii]|uniref:right-handed parallel beta-helix repeat-containing protein n=1 Tax=Pantoea cypripedii TaxID=55209 RepID=UPI002FC9CEB1
MNRRNFIIISSLVLGLNSKMSLSSENVNAKNITQEIVDSLSSNQIVNIPKGEYVIDVGAIKLSSNDKLRFAKDAIIHVNKKDNNRGYVFSIDGESNIEVVGGVFYDDDDSVEVVRIQNGSSGISINEVTCIGCRLTYCNVKGDYEDIDESNLNRKISIKGCQGYTQSVKTRNAFVELRYTKESECLSCTVNGYYHGLMFWGGDSNPKRNGSISNIRKSFNIAFKNNTIRNVQLGGIWGSMGSLITIDSNYLENGGDVGVDFEGCNDSSATNNSIINFKNGGLATFFICNGIKFENNVSSATKKGNVVAVIFNATQKQNNKGISFINNTFVGHGVLTLFKQNGAVDDLLIKSNVFTNVTLNLMSKNNGDVEITNNEFYFNLKPANDDYVVSVSNVTTSGKNITLEDNKIHSNGKWFSDTRVFYVRVFENINSGTSPVVKNNTVENVLSIKPENLFKVTQK